ncbi:SDR family NAD(P)-dependent oxidoreductase [Halalkalibacter sp. APA_J-10(15)]|uniref:SDR family NAD(P)-dependent oxidoreductase n=1 Tax=Halalkalibacter sp. APA_J-10(15) TaxID=2933805 RepID=UPI001FF3BD7A|nr:SDR family oxidoreductase [Halalkalibacter sp. APA_J-10(15)]MCK0472838.1 SDR family oxidoreductase [Halalkalibacter sp. APA_J-10(15)]
MLFSKTAFEGTHILITGATGGIGAQTAKQAAECGASISITGRNKEKLASLVEELSKRMNSAKLTAFPADISQEDDRLQLIEHCERKLGAITGLVNGAAIAEPMTLDELQEEKLTQIMNVNHTATVMLTQHVYQKMKQEQRGSIVNVASLSGLRGTYGGTAYASSKFALIGFTQSLALEAIQSNINVNAICPGFVDTDMAHKIIERKAKEARISYDEQLKKIEAGFPSGKITSPDEVATTILFLLSGAVRNIVGESIKISGGVVV